MKLKRGQYFLMWGCVQVNATNYDRGLWLLSLKKTTNATAVFEEMLIDTGLKDTESTIRENTLFRIRSPSEEERNVNVQDPFYHCTESTSYFANNNTLIPLIIGSIGVVTAVALLIIFVIFYL